MEMNELKSFLQENEENFSIVSRLFKSLEISYQSNEDFVAINDKINSLNSKLDEVALTGELFLGELTFLKEFLLKCLSLPITLEDLDYKYFATMYSILNTIDRRLDEIKSQSKVKSPRFDVMIKNMSEQMRSTSSLPPTYSIAEYDDIDIEMSKFLENSVFTVESLEELIRSITKLEDITSEFSDKKSRILGIISTAFIGLVKSSRTSSSWVPVLSEFCDNIKGIYDSGVIVSFMSKVTKEV